MPADPNELGTLKMPAPNKLLSKFINVLKNVESLVFLTSSTSSMLELDTSFKSLESIETDSDDSFTFKASSMRLFFNSLT